MEHHAVEEHAVAVEERGPSARKKTRKGKVAAVTLVALVAGVFLGFAASAPRAHANAVSDFFNNLLAPLGLGGNSSGTSQGASAPAAGSSSVPLYEPAQSYEQAVVDAVKQAAPAVVSIVISKEVPVVSQCPYNPFSSLPPGFQQFLGNGGSAPQFTEPCSTGRTQLQQVGGGSGFIISSNGLILTNKHVVSDPSASYTVILNNGAKYKATVLARDPMQDIAVVKIDASNLPTVTLGDSSGLELGQTAIAIGNALGQFSNTVSVGVISGLQRTVTATGPVSGGEETIRGVIQTDAAINPGNSGGPLLNLRGQVIGINTAVASGAQNIGFAMPINQAKNDISSVEATGKIEVPYLGVRYLMVTPSLAKSQGLAVDYGALVRGDAQGPAVMPGSPAAKAGLRAEDIIISVDGQKIDQNHDLGEVIGAYAVGQTVNLEVERNGKQIPLSATLINRPAGA